jgi:hypothetical protein
MRSLALEGSGDLRAAFLKNRGTDDHEHPQSAEEGEGAQRRNHRCNHRIDPSWERLTELDTVCSNSEPVRSGEARQCSLYVLICQAAHRLSCQALESAGAFR